MAIHTLKSISYKKIIEQDAEAQRKDDTFSSYTAFGCSGCDSFFISKLAHGAHRILFISPCSFVLLFFCSFVLLFFCSFILYLFESLMGSGMLWDSKGNLSHTIRQPASGLNSTRSTRMEIIARSSSGRPVAGRVNNRKEVPHSRQRIIDLSRDPRPEKAKPIPNNVVIQRPSLDSLSSKTSFTDSFVKDADTDAATKSTGHPQTHHVSPAYCQYFFDY